MQLYVGITDRDWFQFLRARSAVEMNFWHPRGTTGFNVIAPGELFLFKLKYPINKIVGGAYLVRHTILPLNLAWEVFGEANGCSSFETFHQKISFLRGDKEKNPAIGCTVLTDPFYLSDADFWPPPIDMAKNIMTGKSYDAVDGEGARLFEQAKHTMYLKRSVDENALNETAPRYGSEQIIKPRLGQGGFRVVVLEGYERRCSVTGERTLPVLEAAHIQPYSEMGPHDLSNGLLLRSDWHTLFDAGYITITNDFKIEVSRRIKEEFSNGRDYYAYHGSLLKVLPKELSQQPAKQFLEWHQTVRFLS
ncbi:MAG TPA: HNH endonuclease [Verrucomicrobiae bacterium]|nr:HNH endonuclease [Verrucomicrobiae bacterium]